MTISLAALLVQETKAVLYATGLKIATAIGLPVTSWQVGDPSRTQFAILAEILEVRDKNAAGFTSSGFLDYAKGEWLKFKAKQDFNVDVPGATYATTDVVLTNTGGGFYDESDLAPGNLTFKNTVTEKTYRNTTDGGGTLAPLGTVTLTVVADEPGSDSSAGAGEIGELVTSLLGVTCTNPTAAVGIDEQPESTTVQQCRDKLGGLSPDGPAAAYRYVARNADLTGTTAITRARVFSDSDTGDVTVYVAGASGGSEEADRALAETAILKWATPLCVTPTVTAASNVTVAVTYQLWIYESVNKTAAEVKAAVLDALEAMFSGREIGGDIIPSDFLGDTFGALYKTLIESTIRGVFPQAFRVYVSTPASDTSLTNGQVAVLGTVTPTITFIADPS